MKNRWKNQSLCILCMSCPEKKFSYLYVNLMLLSLYELTVSKINVSFIFWGKKNITKSLSLISDVKVTRYYTTSIKLDLKFISSSLFHLYNCWLLLIGKIKRFRPLFLASCFYKYSYFHDMIFVWRIYLAITV